jgi:hypothetical protein
VEEDAHAALAEFLNQKADGSLPATLVFMREWRCGISERGFRRLSGATGFEILERTMLEGVQISVLARILP